MEIFTSVVLNGKILLKVAYISIITLNSDYMGNHFFNIGVSVVLDWLKT